LLVATMAVTWFYPLDRQRFNRVRRLLVRKQRREARRRATNPPTVQPTL